MDLHGLNGQLARAKQVNQSLITKLLEQEILKNKDQIVQFVKDRWVIGKRPDGDIIGTYASFAYQREKLAQNPRAGGNVDLILTGALRDDLTLIPRGNADFRLFSTDEKGVPIANKYGLDVYGLTREEHQQVLTIAATQVFIKVNNFIFFGGNL